MELSHPLRVVTPTLDGDVLAVLAGADQAFTGRELARAIGASQEGTRVVLKRLVEQGTVRRHLSGSAHLYELNRDHLAAPSIAALADLRGEFLRRLRTEVQQWLPAPAYAALFGSVVRRQERQDSDIDLLVVRSADLDAESVAWEAQKARLAAKAATWTGNDLRILDLALSDVTAGSGPGTSRVVQDVLRQGIRIAGSDEVLRASSPVRTLA